jgi:hypothetical protein
VQEQVKARTAAMLARPATAAAEVGLFLESLESLAKDPKSPFPALLATVKEIRSSLGERPTPAAVKDAVKRLEEEAAKLAL